MLQLSSLTEKHNFGPQKQVQNENFKLLEAKYRFFFFFFQKSLILILFLFFSNFQSELQNQFQSEKQMNEQLNLDNQEKQAQLSLSQAKISTLEKALKAASQFQGFFFFFSNKKSKQFIMEKKKKRICTKKC